MGRSRRDPESEGPENEDNHEDKCSAAPVCTHGHSGERRGPEVEEAGRLRDGLPVLHHPGEDVNLTILVGGFRGRDGA